MRAHSMKIDRLLRDVLKPARYIGNEYNSIIKDWKQTPIKVALVFPDIYEIGMSNLGLKILYHIVNMRKDALAERVYVPWPDMEHSLRKNQVSLFSLESRKPISDFDIIGFSLGYEMSYTNVLKTLDLGNIPFYTSQRFNKKYPLIISGGSCSCNPEPIADFIDAIILGDGEDVIGEIIDFYKKHEREYISDKNMFLRKIAGVDGVYVPSMYEVKYGNSGLIENILPKYNDIPEKVKRRIAVLENAAYPVKPVIPGTDIIHNRIVLEIMRGCSRGCRFCQAGMIYRPVRERSPEILRRLTDETLSNTGYNEVSLASLSSTDYSHIKELVYRQVEELGGRNVSISFPSLRIDNFYPELVIQIQKIRRTGLTFAPEAGTQRLRDVINKQVTDDNLFSALESAVNNGWKLIKLYFMYGLPTETQEDLDGIVDLVRRVKSRFRKLSLNITLSSFIPKSHTPFQWVPQDDIRTLIDKREYVKKRLSARVKFNNMELSFIEGVLSQGDRRLSCVIENAYKLGCSFDQWNEHFKFELWKQAFSNSGIDPNFYINR